MGFYAWLPDDAFVIESALNQVLAATLRRDVLTRNAERAGHALQEQGQLRVRLAAANRVAPAICRKSLNRKALDNDHDPRARSVARVPETIHPEPATPMHRTVAVRRDRPPLQIGSAAIV